MTLCPCKKDVFKISLVFWILYLTPNFRFLNILEKVKKEFFFKFSKVKLENYIRAVSWKKRSSEFAVPDKRGIQVFFLFHHKNICCGYSLEVPRQGACNKYPQYIWFYGKIRKISVLFWGLGKQTPNQECCEHIFYGLQRSISAHLLHMNNPLTHCRLNRLSHTIYWKTPISSLGTPSWEIYIFLEKNG